MTAGFIAASNIRDIDLASRLVPVNRFLGTALDWQPLPVERSSNHLFRVVHDGKALVLRINADEQSAFGTVRQIESAVLSRIQAYRWAPQVIHNAWEEGWCLMRDHATSGQENEAATVLAPTSVSSDASQDFVLDAVNQWQMIEDVPPIDYQALFNQYGRALSPTADVYRQLLQRLMMVHQALPEVPSCLTHHDLHRGNVCGEGDHRVVLDWEYAGAGNPWFDAACLHRHFAIDDGLIAGLPAWRSLQQIQFVQGIKLAVWLSRTLDCLWYAVRENQQDKDSDREQNDRADHQISQEKLNREMTAQATRLESARRDEAAKLLAESFALGV